MKFALCLLALVALSATGCRSGGSMSARHGSGDEGVRLIAKDSPSGGSVELESASLGYSQPTPEAKPREVSGRSKMFKSREPLPRTDLKSGESAESDESNSFASGF